MSKDRDAQRTYHTRLHGLDAPALDLLDAYASLYGRVERKLFAAIAQGIPPESLKAEYQRRYGLTARQFNALCRNLKGKVASIRERRTGLIAEARERVKKAEKTVAALENKRNRDGGADHGLANKIHQKKRRLASWRDRLAKLEADQEAGVARLCFGSRKLFRAQFDLEANGYASHAEWREAWEAARSSQFYVLGSKDETAGCQGCVAEYLGENRFRFRLRLPDALIERNAGDKYLSFEAAMPRYGTDHLAAALTLEQAIGYRFRRDEKGWRVFASTKALPFECASDKRRGMIGFDFNADHLAVAETDRFGNLVEARRIPLVLYGCTREQASARVGEAGKQLLALAIERQKPLAVEKLDFAKKKARLEAEGVRYSRMLSSLAYARTFAVIKARAHDGGIEVYQRNPAYTSVIGRHKFAERYGISFHQAAALVIARRAQNLSERPNRRTELHNALPLPARNRGRHVWGFWRQVARKEAAHAARRRPALKSRSCSPPAQAGKARAVTTPPAAGGSPARESSPALFG